MNLEQCAPSRAAEAARALRHTNPLMRVVKAVAGRVVVRADIETLLAPAGWTPPNLDVCKRSCEMDRYLTSKWIDIY